MERVIEVNIKDKYDFIDIYNERKVSGEMINYFIEQSTFVRKNDKLKIIINKKCEIEQNLTQMLKNSLVEEYNKSLSLHHNIDIKQVLLFLLGVISLILYALIKENVIWKEVLLIGGWVGIWEMMDLELFDDASERRKRKTLNLLLTSEIIERENEDKLVG